VSSINPEAEAAREAARVAGKFGEQQHTAPEATIEPGAKTPDVVYDDLSWVHAKDAYKKTREVHELRLASFVADARQAVPDAVQAEFYWEYGEAGPRLVFGNYEDANGDTVDPADIDSYPDVNDFDFEDYKESKSYGFTGEDGTTLRFDDVELPDLGRAQAELSAATKLDEQPDGAAIRHLLTQAMGHGLDPKKVEQLTDEQVQDIRRVLVQAVDMTRMAMEVSR
jgi:hypothetical protein